MLRYSLALTSIFIIKVDFPPNTDILNYGNDNFKNLIEVVKKNVTLKYFGKDVLRISVIISFSHYKLL